MEKLKSQELSVNEFLLNAFAFYYENNFSFALWRLPNTQTLQLASSDNLQEWTEVNVEDAKPGFLFAPFHPEQNKIYLPADELFIFNSGRLSFSKENNLDKIQARADFERMKRKNTPSYYTRTNSLPIFNEDKFISLVTKSRDEIIKGHFEKIVPSRTKTIALQTDFDLLDAFNRLSKLYPHAMVSIFSSPGTGTWVGATPELLVSVSKDQHFHTAAIAGTQPYEEGTDLRAVSWTQKDIEEQALVERYIISCFKKIRLREFEEHGPKTVIAGNLLHLKTDFDVDMTATNFPQLGTIMLKLLHPTSAVCGMPLEVSFEFLKNNEGYDREYYSGYLGPLNVDQESHLYVNLRCMQLFTSEAVLYAGAGVMADSEPEMEWKETELKMNTLQQVIRQ